MSDQNQQGPKTALGQGGKQIGEQVGQEAGKEGTKAALQAGGATMGIPPEVTNIADEKMGISNRGGQMGKQIGGQMGGQMGDQLSNQMSGENAQSKGNSPMPTAPKMQGPAAPTPTPTPNEPKSATPKPTPDEPKSANKDLSSSFNNAVGNLGNIGQVTGGSNEATPKLGMTGTENLTNKVQDITRGPGMNPNGNTLTDAMPTPKELNTASATMGQTPSMSPLPDLNAAPKPEPEQTDDPKKKKPKLG
jgi:hypothetical protein